MHRPFLNTKHKKFITDNRLVMSGNDLAKKLGCSECMVHRYMRSNGLTVSKELQNKFRSIKRLGFTTSNQKTDDVLKQYYLIIPEKVLAQKVIRSHTFVRCRLRQLNLIIPPEIIEQRKQDSRIKRGNVPANKGKEMPADVYKKCKGTMFKKGQVSHNKLPLGSLRVSKDGYLEIKVAEPKTWQAYHRLMWEETFGPIPKGGVVRFVTNNKMNVNPFNLELINRKKNMKLNSVHNLPKDLAQTVQLRGVLNRQINKHLKQLSK